MVEITGSMVTSFLHSGADSIKNKIHYFYRIDPNTGRIDSNPLKVDTSYVLRNPFLLDPTRYSSVPGSKDTEKARLDLKRINPTLTADEIIKKLFGAPPPPPPVTIAQPAPAPIIQASLIPNPVPLAPVAEPTIKQTVSQLLPQLDAPIQGQVNKIPILPIAAIVGVGILIFAVVRKKRK